MSQAYLDVVRVYAAKVFPSNEKRRKGEEPFNLSKFEEVAFGKGGQKKWKRYASNPDMLKFSDAEKMAVAVRESFTELVALAKVKAAEMSSERPINKNDFLNDEKASA